MEATSGRASPSSRRHCYASLPVGPVDRAVTYARLAAERAVQQLAYEEGARLYDMALRALAGAPDGLERMELLLALGDAESRAGETDVAKATFIEGADLARQMGDVERLAGASLGYSGRFVWMRAGSDTKIIPLLHEALAALPEGDSALRVRLLARLAGARRDDWDMRPRDELSAEAVVIAEAIGDPATLAYALISRAMATWGPRVAFDMRVLAERAMGLAAEAGDQEHVAAARLEPGTEHLRDRASRHGAPRVRGLRGTAAELRQPSHLWYAGLMRTSVLLLDGRLDEAEAQAEQTYAEGMRAQSWDAGAAHLLALSALRREQGRLAELEEDLIDAGSLYPGYRLFRCVLARVSRERPRRGRSGSRAWRSSTAARRRCRTTTVGRTAWRRSPRSSRGPATRTSPRSCTRRCCRTHISWRQEAVRSGVGRSNDRSGRSPRCSAEPTKRSRISTRRAVSTARTVPTSGSPAPMWTTRSVRLKRGTDDDRRIAAELLQAAGEVSRRRGWVGIAARVDELTGGPGRDDAPGGLTRREVEVARLVARGKTNREMAEQFVLSERTIETHVQHILTKLGFTSRSEIAAWAVRSGLSDDA